MRSRRLSVLYKFVDHVRAPECPGNIMLLLLAEVDALGYDSPVKNIHLGTEVVQLFIFVGILGNHLIVGIEYGDAGTFD